MIIFSQQGSFLETTSDIQTKYIPAARKERSILEEEISIMLLNML